MLRPIQMDLAIFRSNEPNHVEESRKRLLWVLFGLTLSNVEYLKRHPSTPKLYDSGVIYERENGTEAWGDIPTLLARGYGDCEDLACWRAAELRSEGIEAKPFITWRPGGRGTILHAVVEWPGGKVEDPSRALGMAGNPIVRRPVFIRVA